MQRKYINLIFLHCILPLVAGTFVYLFFRPANFLSHFVGIKPSFTIKNSALRLLFFTLPDFLWSYSLACALFLFALVYQFSFKKSALLIFILVIGSEVVQLAFPRYFTFDAFDLIASVIAFLLSYMQMKKIAYEKENT